MDSAYLFVNDQRPRATRRRELRELERRGSVVIYRAHFVARSKYMPHIGAKQRAKAHAQ